MTRRRTAGYTNPDPPIEVGVRQYDEGGDVVAAKIANECVPTNAPLDPRGIIEPAPGFPAVDPGKKWGIDPLDSIEHSMWAAELPQ